MWLRTRSERYIFLSFQMGLLPDSGKSVIVKFISPRSGSVCFVEGCRSIGHLEDLFILRRPKRWPKRILVQSYLLKRELFRRFSCLSGTHFQIAGFTLYPCKLRWLRGDSARGSTQVAMRSDKFPREFHQVEYSFLGSKRLC
jgi:hypothetical protein